MIHHNLEFVIIGPNRNFGDCLKSFSSKKEKIMDMQKLEDLVHKEAALKIARVESFTCYDITMSLRSWCDEDVNHKDVRYILHTMYNSGDCIFTNWDYVRTTAQFSNGTLVEVFHNWGNVAQEYIDKIDGKEDKAVQCDPCKDKIYDLEYENAHLINLFKDIFEGVDSLNEYIDFI